MLKQYGKICKKKSIGCRKNDKNGGEYEKKRKSNNKINVNFVIYIINGIY